MAGVFTAAACHMHTGGARMLRNPQLVLLTLSLLSFILWLIYPMPHRCEKKCFLTPLVGLVPALPQTDSIGRCGKVECLPKLIFIGLAKSAVSTHCCLPHIPCYLIVFVVNLNFIQAQSHRP
jgi:hypothetical protein